MGLKDFSERKYEDLGALFVSLLYDRVFFLLCFPIHLMLKVAECIFTDDFIDFFLMAMLLVLLQHCRNL